MLTKSEIVKKALVRAGVTPFDQVPTDPQSAQAEEALTSIHEGWINRGIVRWELDNIPAELTNAVVSVTAFAIADDFSVPASKYSRLSVASLDGLRDIQAYNATPYNGTAEIQEF